MPVPASITTRLPVLLTTSTQAVLPPNFTVSGPGEAMEPRVPQNLTYMTPYFLWR
jgi:hypothetical protein